MQGSTSWDYTRAGTWEKDGSWTVMKPGPSKVKRSDDIEAREDVKLVRREWHEKRDGDKIRVRDET